MNKALISVIIPVYNQEKWIARCLRSLENQSIKRENYELIVVNDGSKDESESVINLFSDKITFINNKKNSGLPSALNQGIKRSKSKYVVRVDSDDYVNENFLYLLYEFLEQNKYMDSVACDYLLVDDKEEIIARKNCIHDPIACGIMFQTSHLFEIGLYDEDFRLNEEKELRFRYEKKYKIHRLELPLYRYRRHENNITNNTKDIYEHDQKFKLKHGIN
tara:strand:- start:182 stop:838 length:657 start_codon:yes stop_codon:yes gene_type:complete